VSASGPVAASRVDAPDPGWELAVSVPRSVVASQELEWIVVAREDGRYDRLPEQGRSGVWHTVQGQW
jgi:hypothetical protein